MKTNANNVLTIYLTFCKMLNNWGLRSLIEKVYW